MYKYIIVINIITFIIYGIDKYQAIKQKERISEFSLLLLSSISSYGAALGMVIFHHKTKKIKFKLSVTFFLIINTLIYIKILLKWVEFFIYLIFLFYLFLLYAQMTLHLMFPLLLFQLLQSFVAHLEQ